MSNQCARPCQCAKMTVDQLHLRPLRSPISVSRLIGFASPFVPLLDDVAVSWKRRDEPPSRTILSISQSFLFAKGIVVVSLVGVATATTGVSDLESRSDPRQEQSGTRRRGHVGETTGPHRRRSISRALSINCATIFAKRTPKISNRSNTSSATTRSGVLARISGNTFVCNVGIKAAKRAMRMVAGTGGVSQERGRGEVGQRERCRECRPSQDGRDGTAQDGTPGKDDLLRGFGVLSETSGSET